MAVAGTTQDFTVIFANTTIGMATVKHISLDLNVTAETVDQSVYWALVLVPDTRSASSLATAGIGGELYEPQQDVIACGVFMAPFEEVSAKRLYTPMARKLRQGDQIQFVVRSSAGTSYSINGVIRYALKM